jgi:chemotaxis protein MotB
MAAKDGERPIIVIKKVKKGGHGHHGGSWKVAYADFVTAMMAFFMVMWILGMDENTRKAVEGYFSNPTGFKKGYGSGSSPLANGNSPLKNQDNQIKLIMHRAEQEALKGVGERIKARLDSAKIMLGQAKVEVVMTGGGLRIELIDAGNGEQLFVRGSPEMTPAAKAAISIIGTELKSLRSPVAVEGHTDAMRYAAGARYTNWELSSDRANAARRLLEEMGVDAGRINEVRGYADTQLRNTANPLAAENRRISILLQFTAPRTDSLTVPPPRDSAGATASAGGAEGEGATDRPAAVAAARP